MRQEWPSHLILPRFCWLPAHKGQSSQRNWGRTVRPCMTLRTRDAPSVSQMSRLHTHISATAETTYLNHPLIPEHITIKEHAKIEDGYGGVVKSLPKAMKEKWGSGEEEDKGVKTIMMLWKQKTHQQSHGHCCCTEEAEQVLVITKYKEWHSFSKCRTAFSWQNFAHQIYEQVYLALSHLSFKWNGPSFFAYLKKPVIGHGRFTH